MRRVEVTIGAPIGEEPEEEPGMAPTAESYFVNFVEESEEEGFSAQTVCLCFLAKATEAWLTGQSPEELMALIDHEKEHGEEGTKS